MPNSLPTIVQSPQKHADLQQGRQTSLKHPSPRYVVSFIIYYNILYKLF